MQVTKNQKKIPCIEVNDVSFRYNGETILNRISFAVQQGEYLGIIGPNGGGKTTLIKIILGLLKPDSGSVKIFGAPIKNFTEKSKIGYVPQRLAHQLHQFPATVEEIVKSGRTPQISFLNKMGIADAAAVEKAMNIAGITQYRNRLVSELSGGEKQRVFIARALAAEPSILILDEPSVGVDITSQEAFYSFLEHLNEEYHITILFISHDIDMVAKEVSSILCLNRNLLCYGSPTLLTKEKSLEKIYGKRTQLVKHQH